MNCISAQDAWRLCHWRGARLLSEVEWALAAGGTEGRSYPWGAESPSGARVNAADSALAADRRQRGHSAGETLPWSDGWALTAPVGSFPSGGTPEGVLDLAGNVEEIVVSQSMVNAARSWSDWPPPNSAVSFRGGSYLTSDTSELRAASSWRGFEMGGISSPSIGFRCAQGPLDALE